MNTNLGRVLDLARKQHGVVAVWQMRAELRLKPGQIQAVSRRLTRVHQGVYAVDELNALGWYRAATLALGARAAISHRSALMLLELLPYQPVPIDVSVPGRGGRERRDGIEIHRPRAPMEVGEIHGIPVTSPAQSLRDADLEPYALYRALEEAEKRRYHVTLPLNGVVRLKRAVQGFTRSPAEAMALVLMHENHITLPLVNHRLNGIETDFHWPRERVVLEVDGWEFHKSREQFEEDRRRGLVHTAAGWQVIRVSALQVRQQPELLLRALQTTGW